MGNEHLVYKQYEYVFNRGYPFLISACMERSGIGGEGKDRIEIFKFYVNYNKPFNDDSFYHGRFKKGFQFEAFNTKLSIGYGMSFLLEKINNEILNSGDELAYISLPLQEMVIDNDPLLILQTMPDFKKLKKLILDKSISMELRDKFEKLDEVKFENDLET